MTASFRFGRFVLDPAERQLLCDGKPLELSSRYLDALILLVDERGRLVRKERFLEEVWRGIPVTDEALTQGIKTLRRQLGDDAADPRFIETVPKHGYRFIAAVESLQSADDAPDGAAVGSSVLGATIAGTLGGAIAGIVGGLIYGFAAAAQPQQASPGGVSIVLVVLSLSALVALLGGAGVASGIALSAGQGRAPTMPIIGGAIGGLLVGALVKLIGTDTFTLLLGQAPGNVTGASEGAILGAALGTGYWLSGRVHGPRALRKGVAAAAGCGGTAGLLIALMGGQMMAGSLDLVIHHFPGSRVRLDRIGALFGENGLGPVSRVMTGLLEGTLFGGCVVGAMRWRDKRLGAAD